MYGVFHLRRKKKRERENGFPEFGEIPKVQFCFRLFKLFHLLRTLNSWASTSFQAFKWFFVHWNCLHQHRTELILVANYLCHIKYAKSIRSTFDSRFTQVDGYARAHKHSSCLFASQFLAEIYMLRFKHNMQCINM